MGVIETEKKMRKPIIQKRARESITRPLRWRRLGLLLILLMPVLVCCESGINHNPMKCTVYQILCDQGKTEYCELVEECAALRQSAITNPSKTPCQPGVPYR